VSTEIPRPCSAADFVPVTPPFESGWGAPLTFDPTPWFRVGQGLGFDFPFVVRGDDVWPNGLLGRQDDPLRYVLVPLEEGGWELRGGQTQLAAIHAGTGGAHRFMFSVAEQEAAEGAGLGILGGRIKEIATDHVTLDD
jgi:hypothetical protein